DDLRVRGVGPPHADADAHEVGRAEARTQRLEPVVTGQAAAELRADLAERQVDLVLDGDHVVEVDLQRPTGRAGRVAGFVHVGLRQQDRDARPAGHRAAL